MGFSLRGKLSIISRCDNIVPSDLVGSYVQWFLFQQGRVHLDENGYYMAELANVTDKNGTQVYKLKCDMEKDW